MKWLKSLAFVFFIFLQVLGFFGACTAFVLLEPNPFEWDQTTRMLVVMLAFFFAAPVYVCVKLLRWFYGQ